MRLGLNTPAVVRLPDSPNDWEADADIEAISRACVEAERAGLDYVTCSEHVGVPEPVAAVRGGTYWDPLATLGFIAARTERVRLVTHVLVLGYHHPLAIAKRYGTLDRVSGGRLVLGVGVGTLEEEFTLLGAPFADRGDRADESMRALRASMGVAVPEFHGEYWDYSGFLIDPHSIQAPVPMWVGGRTKRSLRRAAEIGQGWAPFGLGADQLHAMLAATDLPEGFEIVLSPPRLDPLGNPDRTGRAIDALREAGATSITASLAATDLSHYLDQIGALAALAPEHGVDLHPAP